MYCYVTIFKTNLRSNFKVLRCQKQENEISHDLYYVLRNFNQWFLCVPQNPKLGPTLGYLRAVLRPA